MDNSEELAKLWSMLNNTERCYPGCSPLGIIAHCNLMGIDPIPSGRWPVEGLSNARHRLEIDVLQTQVCPISHV